MVAVVEPVIIRTVLQLHTITISIAALTGNDTPRIHKTTPLIFNNTSIINHINS